MPTRLLARSEAQRCAHCDVFVPAGKMQQHVQGKRHLSMLWYGEDGHRVRDIELWRDGTLERRFRPFDVPERTVEAVRRARAAVTAPILVAHSGVVLFDRVCKCFDPELLCVAEMRTQKRWKVCPIGDRCYRTITEVRSPLEFACIANEIRSEQGPCSLVLPFSAIIANSDDEIGQLALSFALHALTDALGAHREPHAVTLVIGSSLQERRLATQLVDGLRRVIDRNPALEMLFFSAAGGAWRAEDAATLLDAAVASRRARVVSLLLGSHARAGADSPIRRLPLVLLRMIAEKAGLAGRLPVDISIDPGAAPAAAPAPAAHNPGADLAAIAALVV